jgi:hypothetical protein
MFRIECLLRFSSLLMICSSVIHLLSESRTKQNLSTLKGWGEVHRDAPHHTQSIHALQRLKMQFVALFFSEFFRLRLIEKPSAEWRSAEGRLYPNAGLVWFYNPSCWLLR